MVGRPPKPRELKKLEGTYRKDRDKGVLTFEKITDIPRPPTHLTTTARKIWKEITEILISVRILEIIDLHTVAMLCEELATYYEMNKIIKKQKTYTYINGSGNLVRRPELSIRNRAMENANKLMAQMGLTPAMRQKFGAGDDGEKPTDQKGKISLR